MIEMKRGLLALVAATVVLTCPARAGDLKTPFALETSATLPKGVRNPRFINVFSSIGTRFADNGAGEPLGNSLNKIVTWNDLLAAQEDDIKRTNLQGLLKGMEDRALIRGNTPGSTSGEVKTFADVKVAALAIGITDKLTLAGVLPIVKIDVKASTGFVASSEGNTFVNELATAQSPLVAYDASNKLNDAINQKLTRLGYEPIPSSQTISGVGDAQLVAKFRVRDDGVNGISLKGGLVFPTGTPPNADKALDIPTGDGRFGMSLGAIYDRALPFDFRWNSYGTYTALMPRTIVRRIPTSVADNLSADKEEMHENLRSQFAVGSGIEHRFPRVGLAMGGGYAFQYQTRANYDAGTTYSEDRYYLLNRIQPAQAMHSMLVSAGFSTVEWFKQKKFFYPFQVNLSYTHPLAGRNVASNDLMVGELVLFF
jgi:hypothetical protein